MQTPDYYRHRAQEVRHLGETLRSPELREQMNMLAKEYEYLAVTAEHMAVAAGHVQRSFRSARRVAPTAKLDLRAQHRCARSTT